MNPKNISIAIILLQYNGSAQTIRCLTSVNELDYLNFRTFVVDNHSSPDELNHTKKFIESQNQPGQNSIEFIQNADNIGYSGGNNIGIKRALSENCDYVLILNPDTILDSDLLKKLIIVGESANDIGLVAPAIQEDKIISYGGKISWLRPELTHLPSKHDRFDYLPGACLLIARRLINAIGLFDENYFLYFEDADYAVRARRAGFVIKLVPEPLVRHRVSSSTDRLGKPLLLRYHYRNALYFNWHQAPFGYKVLLPFWIVWIIFKQLGKWLIQPEEHDQIRAILAGVFDFLSNRMGKI